jgi:hypothetical protein
MKVNSEMLSTAVGLLLARHEKKINNNSPTTEIFSIEVLHNTDCPKCNEKDSLVRLSFLGQVKTKANSLLVEIDPENPYTCRECLKKVKEEDLYRAETKI